jgi:2',3'-cyclic-nucleotide 2'-phosphodiesterase (5'-nucleotidase family)
MPPAPRESSRLRFGFLLSCLALCLLAASGVPAAPGATVHLLVLHTNDLHDHVRPGYNGLGGLPYVAGYIESVKAGRRDVLVLDAGDVTEKGDLVAFKTHSMLTYEMMRRIGYDAIAIGNHDFDAGPEWLGRYSGAAGRPLLCLNLVGKDGSPAYTPSRTIEVGGISVGIIGMIVPQDAGSMDKAQSGRALEAEALRLRQKVRLVIALCHEGTQGCAAWSLAAPDVDVFVSGHTHEALMHPVPVAKTGAIIVQAGCNAQWVGRLELEVDPGGKGVVSAEGTLVPMRQDSVPVDRDLLALVRRREQELCPDASDFVFQNADEISADAVAWLAAAALRLASGADLGFCQGGQIVRSPLPKGPVDFNAVFATGGQRGFANVRAELTGAEVSAYVLALPAMTREHANWSGFAAVPRTGASGGSILASDLDPGRTYSVVMPEKEWSTRFMRVVGRIRQRGLGGPLAGREFTCVPARVTYAGALRDYLRELVRQGRDPGAEARRLMEAATAPPAPSAGPVAAVRPPSQPS